jgi:hypothetical protein
MPNFHPMFSDKWEAERAEFYRGLFPPDPTRPEDDDVTKFAVGMVHQWGQDPLTLLAAVTSLRSRLIAAHDVLSTYDVTLPEMHGVQETISDSALVMAYLVDALGEHGSPHAPAIQLKKRGAARASSAATVRDAFAVAAEVERRVAAGEQQEAVIRSYGPDPQKNPPLPGIARETILRWLGRYRALAKQIAAFDGDANLWD